MSNLTELLRKAIEKKRSYRSAGHNNYITYDNGIITVRYHNTDIAVIDLDERTITLNTGGWTTPTTKERMNEALYVMGIGRHVWQEKWIWFYGRYNGEKSYFFDGMKIEFTTGNILNPIDGPDIDKDKEARKLLNKLLNAYVKEFKKVVKEGGLTESAGDCFDCAFMTEEGETMGETKANEIKDEKHLYHHLIEKYVMRSLTYNALVKAGANASFFFQGHDTNSSWATDMLIETGTRALRKYFRLRIDHMRLAEMYEEHKAAA
jgi:hypothetical protein